MKKTLSNIVIASSDVSERSNLCKFFTLLFFVMLCFWESKGEEFQYYSKLDSVKENAFHTIFLHSTIIAKAKKDFSDIRLYDEEKKEIPYILYQENPISYQTLFHEYKIISKKRISNKKTELIIQNPLKNSIDNIHIEIKNTNITKYAQLSGSNDGKEWFGIEEDILLQSLYSESQTSQIKILNFPLSDYEFYKLEIADSNTAPLNIIKIGFYDTYTENGKYELLSEPTIEQNDSSKKSFIKIRFSDIQKIDKIKIEIDTPNYFYRTATLYKYETRKVKQKNVIVTIPIQNERLLSGGENTFHCSNLNEQELLLVIDNKDNVPLHIKKISAYQLRTYLVAELQKEKMYSLYCGNEKLSAPVYDLRYFAEKIPQQRPSIQTQKAENISTAKMEAPKTTFTSPIFIWSALGIVVIFLVFMSNKMLKEMKKKK